MPRPDHARPMNTPSSNPPTGLLSSGAHRLGQPTFSRDRALSFSAWVGPRSNLVAHLTYGHLDLLMEGPKPGRGVHGLAWPALGWAWA